MQKLKGASSAWINQEHLTNLRFGWQDGYAAFTLSPSMVARVTAYIANQREHHQHASFEEEFRLFLQRHDVDFEERYAFG